jgi:hypothetical protein
LVDEGEDMKLSEFQYEWVKLFNELSRENKRLSFPFLSSAPKNYESGKSHSILYVGKSTDGPWNDEKQNCQTPNQFRAIPQNFMKDIAGKEGPYAFWRFARRLGGFCSPASPYQNLVWTNLAKIGVLKGTPNEKVFRAQEDLAIATLKSEIETYQPALVVFVTGDYHPNAIYEVTGSSQEWQRGLENTGLWWRAATKKTPALIWTYHPQGKTNAILQVWAEKARELLQDST